MSSQLELAEDKFIDSIGRLCDSFGLNRFIAQLYAVLYLSSKPLSLDEITEKLKVSKGNVSINIRELENWGAVRSIWVKGSRKDYYEANLDIKGVILKKVKTGMQKRIGETSDMISGFKSMIQAQGENLSQEDVERIKIYEERLKKIEDLKAMVSTALTFADKLF